jgi:spermidine synthase
MRNFQNLVIYSSTIIAGSSTMVFELVAPRLLAPYIGTSHYVWTIVIGIVMASLSLGYFLGGKLSEKKPTLTTLSAIYLVAGMITLLVFLTKDVYIYSLMSSQRSNLSTAWTASLLLLAPLTFTLGMITPISIALLSGKDSAGKTSGNVYSLSTIGSLLGTFAAGFWLIPNFSLSNIILSVSLMLIFSGMILITSKVKKILLVVLLITLTTFYSNSKSELIFKDYYEKYSKSKIVADINTQYNRVWIKDHKQTNGNVLRTMSDFQSLLILNKPLTAVMEDRLSYYSYFNLFASGKKNSSVLMIGGGAYTYANYLQLKYPDLKIDVVEIDPELLGIAQQYFNFKPGKNFSNYNMDGREFLNFNTKKYDAIFLDAYQNGSATPFQLITQEAMDKLRNSLAENGELYINVVSSMDGSKTNLLLSEYKTLSSIFKFVDVFPVFLPDPTRRQNYVIVGKKNDRELNSNLMGLNLPVSNMERYLGNQKLLTDDYAPVEYYDLQGIL